MEAGMPHDAGKQKMRDGRIGELLATGSAPNHYNNEYKPEEDRQRSRSINKFGQWKTASIVW